MPLYEYRCDHCGYECEVIVKFSDPPPVCDHSSPSQEVLDLDKTTVEQFKKNVAPASMTKKLSKSTGFSLKGGGWYRDGYSSKVKGK